MKSVVVIDDHPVVLTAVKTYFEKTDDFLVVGEALDGGSGIELVRRFRPDLIILDLFLAGMDGLTLIRHVRTVEPASKVLVLSARDEPIYIHRAAEAGAHGFVTKAVALDVIVQAARSVLAGFQLFPESPASARRERPGEVSPNELTHRELAVLSHIAHGYRNKDIANKLYLSPKTVSTYKVRLMNKLGLGGVLDLIDYARAHGIV